MSVFVLGLPLSVQTHRPHNRRLISPHERADGKRKRKKAVKSPFTLYLFDWQIVCRFSFSTICFMPSSLGWLQRITFLKVYRMTTWSNFNPEIVWFKFEISYRMRLIQSCTFSSLWACVNMYVRSFC